MAVQDRGKRGWRGAANDFALSDAGPLEWYRLRLSASLTRLVTWTVSIVAGASGSAAQAGGDAVSTHASTTSDPDVPAKAPFAKVSLQLDRARVAPGQEVLVGVRFTMQPGWHIYWNGRNDSGVAPEITWTLPKGVTAGAVRWPAPKRYVLPGDLLDHVYDGDMALVVPVRVDPAAAPGPLTISAAVDYLICKDACVPEKAVANATIDVSGDAPAAPAAGAVPEPLKTAVARLPQSGDAATKAVRVEWTADAVRVAVDGAKTLKFFPQDDCVGFDNLIRDGQSSGAALRLALASTGGSGEPDVLSGVVEVEREDGKLEWFQTRLTRPAMSPATGR